MPVSWKCSNPASKGRKEGLGNEEDEEEDEEEEEEEESSIRTR